MGAILSGLRGRDGVRGSAIAYSNVMLNFNDPTVTPSEQALVARLENLVSQGPMLLSALRAYRGSQEPIKNALQFPTPDNEEAAWASLAPAVQNLLHFYEYSRAIEQALPELMQELCVPPANSNSLYDAQSVYSASAANGAGGENGIGSAGGGMASVIMGHQALVKQFADILSFAFEFDELKMTAPSIQNDFAFYKRTAHRMAKSHNEQVRRSVIPGDVTNRMSLFFAYHNPMFRVVIDAVTQFVNSLQPRRDIGSQANVNSTAIGSNVLEVSESIAVLCAGCYNALNKRSLADVATMQFCLRVMVSCAVLYDNIHPVGIFVKDSPINIPNIVRTVLTNGSTQRDTLLNALRFSTKHLNDASTPRRTKELLNAAK
ncbi:DUF1394-domain-containing protein [Ramicandelaber brevisporus]|nr:DUF1394-domain-containing protein [Ramicandelaber brevisporus]